MAELIAIGYDSEDTAERAERTLERMAGELQIEPDAAAVIIRDGDGTYRVHTNHHPVSTATTWGMLWGALFGLLYFAPVFGMAVGAGLGSLMRRIERIGIDPAFQEDARDMLQPGTSTLFVVVENGPAPALDALSAYGGRAIATPLSAAAQSDLQDHLHGYPDLTA
jgi:uncharacterized membrane protein